MKVITLCTDGRLRSFAGMVPEDVAIGTYTKESAKALLDRYEACDFAGLGDGYELEVR